MCDEKSAIWHLAEELTLQPNSEELHGKLDAAIKLWMPLWHQDRDPQYRDLILYPPSYKEVQALVAKFPALGRWAAGFAHRALTSGRQDTRWNFVYNCFDLGCKLPVQQFQAFVMQFLAAEGVAPTCATWLLSLQSFQAEKTLAAEVTAELSQAVMTTALLCPGGVKAFVHAQDPRDGRPMIERAVARAIEALEAEPFKANRVSLLKNALLVTTTSSSKKAAAMVSQIMLRQRPKLDQEFAKLLAPSQPFDRHQAVCHIVDNLLLAGVQADLFPLTFDALFALLPERFADIEKPSRALTVLMTTRALMHCASKSVHSRRLLSSLTEAQALRLPLSAWPCAPVVGINSGASKREAEEKLHELSQALVQMRGSADLRMLDILFAGFATPITSVARSLHDTLALLPDLSRTLSPSEDLAVSESKQADGHILCKVVLSARYSAVVGELSQRLGF